MRWVKDQRGATIVEYSILLFLILVTGAVAFRVVGKGVRKAGDMTIQQFH